MRRFLFCAAVTAFSIVTLPATNLARAAEWPWCAILTMGPDDLARNCGFANRQQCLATVSGIGGWCELNPRYRAEAPRRWRDRERYR